MSIQAAGPPAPATTVLIGPEDVQMSALIEQQTQGIGRLVQLEGDRAALRKRLTSASGDEATQLRRQLNVTESLIEGEQAKLQALKSRMSELPLGTQVVNVPPPVLVGHDGRMFGLSNDEFKAAFSFVIVFPLVVAVAVRLLRRKPAAQAPSVLEDNRLARLEQAVESVAIEVERISESQRFQAKLMAEKQPDSVPRR
jgi:hypothetical protein